MPEGKWKEEVGGGGEEEIEWEKADVLVKDSHLE